MKSFIYKHITLLYFIFSVILAFILQHIFYGSLKSNEFIFIHDEYVLFSITEAITASLFRIPIDFGISNGVPLLVNFFERYYYLAGYLNGFSINSLQSFLYFVKVIIIVFIPFLGFKKIASIFNQHIPLIAVILVSLFYSFNTFTLINWNGSFFLTYLICYSIAPITFYFYHKAIFTKGTLLDYIIAAIGLFIMSFIIYIFGVFAVFLFSYTVMKIILSKAYLDIFKRILILGLVILPLFSTLLFVFYEFFSTAGAAVSNEGGETYGNISGGVLYQFFMWFSWGIYNIWIPRNILTFTDYLRTNIYILSPFILYTFVIYGLIKHSQKNIHLVIIFACFLINLLFIKGAQRPLEYIYIFLLKYVPLFRIFRSPDMKFAFTYIFILALLLLIVSPYLKKKVFAVGLLIVIIIQSWMLFTPYIVQGLNTDVSSDRIMEIPSDYTNVTNFVNSKANSYSYNMTVPSESFAIHRMNNKFYIGQDLLPKLTNNPYVYLSSFSAMPLQTSKTLNNLLEKNDVSFFKTFPIRYFIVRNDFYNPTQRADMALLQKKLTNNLDIAYKNKVFTVFQNKYTPPILLGNNITFEANTPVAYTIHIKNISDIQDLSLLQNFSKGWDLYLQKYNEPNCTISKIHPIHNETECARNTSSFTFFQPKPTGKLLFEKTQSLVWGYANGWKIDPQKVKKNADKTMFQQNKDGTINVKLMLFFTPQSSYDTALRFTIISLMFYGVITIVLSLRKKA